AGPADCPKRPTDRAPPATPRWWEAFPPTELRSLRLRVVAAVETGVWRLQRPRECGGKARLWRPSRGQKDRQWRKAGLPCCVFSHSGRQSRTVTGQETPRYGNLDVVHQFALASGRWLGPAFSESVARAHRACNHAHLTSGPPAPGQAGRHIEAAQQSSIVDGFERGIYSCTAR